MTLRTRALGTLAVGLVLAVALCFGVTASAFAAAPDPILGLAALKTKLDASPDGIAGYFKTVDKGSTIETIPVTVLAITGGTSASSSLILFEATGAKIDKFGGIVAGMSGSPVYVDDGGVDKVIGAVSYGDYFTKGGTGLATPIELMQAVRSTYLPEFQTLAKPLVTTDGVVRSVVLAPDPASFAVQARQGAFVASPLSAVFIGGLRTNSAGYSLLSKELAAHGESVVPLASALSGSPSVGDQTFSTDLVPGAAVAALSARGDMWVGGVGTVTYTDTDTVLAFGHPAMWTGPSSLYMTNAWIDGVWPSTYEPYKLARPTALRGTIVQDRSAGILGQLGAGPAETTFTATAVDADSGATTSSAVYMPRQFLINGTPDQEFTNGIDPIDAAMGVYVAGENLEDAWLTPGSAEVTTTVTATDGTTTYTVSIPNRVDSGYDIPLAVIQDAANVINVIQSVPTDGVHHATILSVDMKSRFHATRAWGQILGVKLPHGLQHGVNPVQVLALEYGRNGTQTIDTSITIPASTKLTGMLLTASQSVLQGSDMFGSGGSMSYSKGFFDSGVTIYMPSGPVQSSLASAVAGMNANLPNNVISVLFLPSTSDGSSDDFSNVTPASSILTTVATDRVFSGDDYTSVGRLVASAQPSTIGYEGESMITASLVGPSTNATLTVWATPYGGTESYVGAFGPEDSEDAQQYMIPVGPLDRTTTFRVHYDGGRGYAAAEALVTIKARPRVVVEASAKSAKAGAKVKLTSTVWPIEAAGTSVAFEYNDYSSHWKRIATQTLVAGGSSASASTTWKVAKGKHKLRVRFLGSASNSPSSSGSLLITGS